MRHNASFFSDRSQTGGGLSPFKIRLVHLTESSSSFGRLRMSGSAEGGLAKYLITFELTYRYREITGLFLAPRLPVSALRNVVIGYMGHSAAIPSLARRRSVPHWNES